MGLSKKLKILLFLMAFLKKKREYHHARWNKKQLSID
jgi:hypothetical protein